MGCWTMAGAVGDGWAVGRLAAVWFRWGRCLFLLGGVGGCRLVGVVAVAAGCALSWLWGVVGRGTGDGAAVPCKIYSKLN